MNCKLISALCLVTGFAQAATPINGWYSSVFGGFTYLPDNVTNTTLLLYRDGLGYNGGYNAGGRFGFQSNPLRYEGEYTYLHADLKHFEINHIRQNNVRGYGEANLIMANIYYDFPDMLPAISPFLGGGLGFANIQASLASTEFAGSGYPFYTQLSISDNKLAYQGTVGLTFNFCENYAVNLSYRYLATNKSSAFGDVFQAHIASAGAIYRFDQGFYQ
jgi:opacity protein-like surface antigen